ncbi:MAG: hypothetical protein ACYS8X_07880 [Planctomycetota bacterium]|jgi:hypothetical protein
MDVQTAPPVAPVTAAAPLKLTAFIKTFVIMDLVFSCLRIIFGLIGAVAAGNTPYGSSLAATVPFELTGNFGMGVFGIIAAILLLGRKPTGVVLGWIKVVFAVLALCVGFWQIFAIVSDGPGNQPEGYVAGYVFGSGLTLLVRAALLVCYAIAISKAGKLFQIHQQTPTFGAAPAAEGV